MTQVDLTHIPSIKHNNSLLTGDQSTVDTKESSTSISSCNFLNDDDLYTFVTSSTPEDLFPKTISYTNQSVVLNNINQTKSSSSSTLLKFSTHSTSFTFQPKTIIYDISFIGNLLIVAGDKYIKVYDIENNNELVSTYVIYNDNLYCLSLTTFYNGIPIVAVGGQSNIIHIINILEVKEMHTLIGHKNEIYDLKFHPHEHLLLLSASKDSSIRLWNAFTKDQLCIFGGPLGHSAEVLSIDWHCSGDYFASSGIDNSVKIWKINTPKIKTKINQSLKNKGEFKQTLIKTTPFYTCNTVHDNYIDSIKFNGNFIISKSVDGVVKEWLPLLNKEGDSFYMINSFKYNTKDKIWYVKLCFVETLNAVMVGNESGKVHLFCNDDAVNDNLNDVFDTKTDTVIRAICYSDEYNLCGFASNKGEVVLTKIVKEESNEDSNTNTKVNNMNTNMDI